MAITTIINEKSAADLVIEFFDNLGSPVVPTTATYQVDCISNQQNVRTATAITPLAATVTITLTESDNTIINNINPYEHRQVLVRADASTNDAKNETYEYRVKNLYGMT